MANGLSIRVFDRASPAVRAMAETLARPEALLLPVARKGANLLRQHYRQMESAAPNKLGGKRTHWWRQVGESVNNPILTSPTAAQIEITQPGAALRLHGGTVRPRESSALAIPIHRESYGIWARDWQKQHPERPLFKIRGARGVYLAASPRGSKRLQILYVLRGVAQIPPDPRVLPDSQEFGASLSAYAEQRLATLLRRQNSA